MLQLFFIFILLMFYSVRCQNITNNSLIDLDFEDRIYNGYEVGIHDFSYAVFLLFEATSPSSCGGSLILVQAVLTAAHCVDELRFNRGKMHAYFGATTPKKSKVVRRVVDYRINEKYNEHSGKNNIAVVFLQDRVPLQHEIKKIPLAKSDPMPDDIVYSAGWGKQNIGRPPKLPDFSSWRPLRATKQRVLARYECTKYAGFKVSPPLFCSVSEYGHFYKDDAGNGLITMTPTTLLLAVMSFEANGVTFYTGVDAHRNWIASVCHTMYTNNCVRKGR